MRRLLTVAIAAFFFSASYSQKAAPAIKKGTVLTYNVSVNGQSFPVVMQIDSLGDEFSKFAWTMEGQGNGTVTNAKNSTLNATHGYWGELRTGEDMTVGDDQSILLLSKAHWAAIQKDKKLTYDDQVFTLKDATGSNAFKLKDQEVDVLYLENAAGTTKIWVLNNPSAPLIVKLEGNPQGIDIDLSNLEQK